MYQNTHHLMWWVKAKHQFRIRDASQDRQPEIQSSLVREIFKAFWARPKTCVYFWKPVNLQDCVWENHCRLIKKTILQEKETNHYSIIIWFTNLFQAMKIPAAKAAVDKEWEKLEKISAWNLTKVRSKKEVIDEARTKGAKDSFRLIDGHMSFKECWTGDKAPKIQRSSCTPRWYCKRRFWVLRSFNEQGSSASQMTAAKIMDIISRLPGCDGQAADAVSAYTQVKMEDAHKLFKIQKSECPDIWIRLPRHKWHKSWSSMEDPVVPLERNLYGHPLAGILWERQFAKILLNHGWEKIPSWECFVHREKGLFLSVFVDDIKNWLERNKTLTQCGKYSIKKLIWENQHLFWIMCTWDALNVNAK